MRATRRIIEGCVRVRNVERLRHDVLAGLEPMVHEEIIYRHQAAEWVADAYWFISDTQRGINIEIEFIGKEEYAFISLIFNKPFGAVFEYDKDDTSLRDFLRSFLVRKENYHLTTFFGKVYAWSPSAALFYRCSALVAVARAFGFKENVVSWKELRDALIVASKKD